MLRVDAGLAVSPILTSWVHQCVTVVGHAQRNSGYIYIYVYIHTLYIYMCKSAYIYVEYNLYIYTYIRMLHCTCMFLLLCRYWK